MRGLKKKVQIDASFSADDWQLYTSSLDCAMAASCLNAMLMALVNQGNSRHEVEVGMSKEMSRLSKYGASDSEPRYVLECILDEVYK